MEKEKDMKALADRYFEGRILRNEEERLLSFIRESEENHSLFKAWEHAWLLTSVADDNTENEWKRLQNKMRVHETVTPMLSSSRFVFWRKVAAVAAIVILTAGATLGIWNTVTYLQPETYFTLEAPYGEKSKVTLSDGTEVWLNAGSKLQYSNKFNADNRTVKLDGEGYFEVTKHEGKLFTVETPAYSVVVKGTKFNVSAYPDDSFVSTTLIEGSVELLYGGKELRMYPGEALRLNLASGKFVREKVNAPQSRAWADNRLESDHITLRELVQKLSRQYDVKIELESEQLGEKAFRISLRNQETIGEVMDALQKLIPITVERKEEYIYIRE